MEKKEIKIIRIRYLRYLGSSFFYMIQQYSFLFVNSRVLPPKIFQQNEGRIKERKGKFTANMNNTCFNTAGTIVTYYVYVT